MRTFSTISFFFIFVLSSPAQYAWVNKSSFPGSARFQLPAFSINGMGYIIAGCTQYSPSVTDVNEVWQYSPAGDSWTQKTNFPLSVAQPAYFSINNYGYIVGGAQTNDVYVSNTYKYDPGNDSWTAKSSFPESGVGATFQFVIDSIAYVGGGARNSNQPGVSVYSYTPSTDSWSSLASYPSSLSLNMVGFAIDNFGYAGLGTDGNGNYTNQFYKYDPSANSWSSIAPFPGKPRCAAHVFVIDGKAYVGGGVKAIGTAPNIYHYGLDDYYVYDPTLNTWSPVPGYPGSARWGSAAFALNGNGYVVCGYDGESNQMYKDVSEFGACNSLSAIMPVPGGGNQWEIMVYPNPSSGNMNVKINAQLSSAIQYDLVSVDGKQLKTGSTRDNQFELNTGNLADGVYVITVKDNNGVQGVKRFEVMH